MLYCDRTSRVPPVPATHSAACRSPPPDRSIVAPGLSATLLLFTLTNFPGGPVTSGEVTPATGLNCHSTPSTVVPYGMIKPPSETEVTLPLANVTESVATSGRVPWLNCASVVVSVGSPTPNTSVPDGARTVPPCTMRVASTSSEPPADRGVPEAPFDSNVIVVGACCPVTGSVGPTASRINVLPVAGYRSAALKLRLPGV